MSQRSATRHPPGHRGSRLRAPEGRPGRIYQSGCATFFRRDCTEEGPGDSSLARRLALRARSHRENESVAPAAPRCPSHGHAPPPQGPTLVGRPLCAERAAGIEVSARPVSAAPPGGCRAGLRHAHRSWGLGTSRRALKGQAASAPGTWAELLGRERVGEGAGPRPLAPRTWVGPTGASAWAPA